MTEAPGGSNTTVRRSDDLESNLAVFIDQANSDRFVRLKAQKAMVQDFQETDVPSATHAANYLVTNHIGLVAALAYEYKQEQELEGSVDDLPSDEDLMEDGKAGLLIAVRTYDLETDFSDHVVWIVGKYLREGTFEEADFAIDYEVEMTEDRPFERMQRLAAELNPAKLARNSRSPALNTSNQIKFAHMLDTTLGQVDIDKVSEIIDDWPVSQQTLIRHMYLAEFRTNQKDIAKHLGLSPSQFKSLHQETMYRLMAEYSSDAEQEET